MTSGAAVFLFARLSWKRLLRGKAIYLSALLLALPVVIAIVAGQDLVHWKRPFNTCALLLAIIPPLHLATAVSDEIDDNTFTYLWSRPIPRWTMVVGKLVGLAPALAIVMGIPIAIAFFLVFRDAPGDHINVLVRALSAMAVGVFATGMLAIGLGAVIPKFPLPAVIAYMLLFDTVIGAIPFAVNRLAISHNVREIAGIPEDSDRIAQFMGISTVGAPVASAVWALAIGAIWLGIALWRVSVAEYATHK